jgi:translation initiation factor IF-3
MILSNLFIIGSNNKQASIILKCTQQALTSNEGQSVDLVVIDMNNNILHP